jgi:hypothetical protein
MTSARTHDAIHFFWPLDLHTFLCLDAVGSGASARASTRVGAAPLDSFTALPLAERVQPPLNLLTPNLGCGRRLSAGNGPQPHGTVSESRGSAARPLGPACFWLVYGPKADRNRRLRKEKRFRAHRNRGLLAPEGATASVITIKCCTKRRCDGARDEPAGSRSTRRSLMDVDRPANT